MRLIVGMTGATGAPLAVTLLQALRDMDGVETHLVMSKWAKTCSHFPAWGPQSCRRCQLTTTILKLFRT